MPILESNTDGSARTICQRCGYERNLKRSHWVTFPGEPSVFASPPCPRCKKLGLIVTESFEWHDEIHTDGVSDQGNAHHYGARLMAHQAEIAKALGLEQRRITEHAERELDGRPRTRDPEPTPKPSADEVRAIVRILRGDGGLNILGPIHDKRLLSTIPA